MSQFKNGSNNGTSISPGKANETFTEKEIEEFFKFYDEKRSARFDEKYKPLTNEDYSRFISVRNSKRVGAMARVATSLAYKMGKKTISLAEGLPHEDTFPVSKIQLQLKGGEQITLEGTELSTAFQYVPSRGLPALKSCLEEFQQFAHRPPRPCSVIVTNGGQNALTICFELLLESGDPLITTEFIYTTAMSALKPYELEILGIPEDKDGMRDDLLEKVLFTRKVQGQKMPRVLYVEPTGHNPSGTIIPEERRRKLYALACEYDLLILEDDPYMFLNYSGKQLASFLSLDACGRVVRADSLSKVLAPGLRSGWVTAPEPLVQRLEMNMAVELGHPCAVSQTIVHRLLSNRSSLMNHLLSTKLFYQRKRDMFHRALLEAGLAEVAEWTIPDAGLYMWIKVKGVDNVYNMVFDTALKQGLMMLPGQAFLYDSSAISQHLRLTFGKVDDDKMDTAARILVASIRIEQKRDAEKIV